MVADCTRMDTFYQVFGFVAAICIGIIALASFLGIVSFFKSKTRGFDVVKLKGFIKEAARQRVFERWQVGAWSSVCGVH